ncbi:radical SAM protein [Methanosarcinaceae archaeon]|nr:radical SAM protein [Methanosarcinaceae archaeon]
MDIPLTLENKAFLLSVGTVSIDPSLVPPQRKSTAGPGAGTAGSVFFRSGGRRVRLTIDPASPLSIFPVSGAEEDPGKDRRSVSVAVFYGKDLIATGVLERPPAHCPGQAYLNISERCIFNCRYCSVPKLAGKVKSKEEILEIVQEAWENGPVEAISITSGVAVSPEDELEKVLAVLPDLLKYGVPVGVSIYPTADSSERLKKAGVSEVKYNLESPDREIFGKVCPELSYDEIMASLKEAVTYFGKGNVYTNMIAGLGETDEAFEERLEELAQIGVMTDIRPVSVNPLRRGECFMEKPSAERLLKLFGIQERICLKYGLRPDRAKTLCAKCGGCDLVCLTDSGKTDSFGR